MTRKDFFHGFDRKPGLGMRWMLILATVLLVPSGVGAQEEESSLRIAVRQDGTACVYLKELLPIGYGFNIDRRDPGQEFKRLNEDPVHGATSGGEFQYLMGEEYSSLSELMKEKDPQLLLFKLRGDPDVGYVATYLYPSVARALGHLYVDQDAPRGERVTYRVEIVDPFGDPTGQVVEEEAKLDPLPLRPPTDLAAENTGLWVSLTWHYPRPSPGVEDHIVQFFVYRTVPGRSQPERLNRAAIVRDDATDAFLIRFKARATGVEEEYFVTAVDITGEESDRSEVLRFLIKDNIAPEVVTGVEAELLAGDEVLVRWQGSDEPDVVGYNVYRAMRVDDETYFRRINTERIGFGQTNYKDRTITGSGGRTYFYGVRAVDASGNESDFGGTPMVQVEDHAAPAGATAVDATFQEDGSVLVRWQAEKISPDLMTWVIFRRCLDPGAGTALARANMEDITATEFVDRGPIGDGFLEGSKYRFDVMAMDSVRNASDTVSTVIEIPNRTPPEPPGHVTTDVDQAARALVMWHASPSMDVDGYIVYRSAEGGAEGAPVRLARTERRFQDEDVERGRNYTYQVSAIDVAGNESVRSDPVTLLVRDTTSPREVRNVRARGQEGGGIVVTWEPVVAGDLSGYRVFRATIENGIYEPVEEETLSETRWIDRSGQVGLWYRVSAIDTSGNLSKPSQPAQAVRAETGREGR